MTTTAKPAPSFTVDVDLTNPGQFLACCGLLELASRLDGHVLSWFDDGRFYLTGAASGTVVPSLLAAEVVAIPTTPAVAEDADADPADKSPPLRVGGPFHLRLDWWTDSSAVRAGFKTWAGGQTVAGFWTGMRDRLRDRKPSDARRLLTDAGAVAKPKPFYFDARLSRLTALDAGFSTERFTAAFSPAVELLALVGLQRFRPGTVEPRERYAFDTWAEPLPVSVAAAVAHGLIPTLSCQRFTFPLVVRTGGKYKAFGPAMPAGT